MRKIIHEMPELFTWLGKVTIENSKNTEKRGQTLKHIIIQVFPKQSMFTLSVP